MTGKRGDEVTLRNGGCLPLAALPARPWPEFAADLEAGLSSGGRVAAYFASPGPAGGLEIFAVVARDRTQDLLLLRTPLGESLPSLARPWPALQLFEREIAEQYGIKVEGHPWFKPVRMHRSWRPGRDAWDREPGRALVPGDIEYYRVEGDEVHEVAVGPVHAGIIEPGHFRFQCHGEKVLHLEIVLGYQHRGIEPRLTGAGGTTTAALHQLETVSGDTTVGHLTCHSLVREALAQVAAPARGAALRGVALELERVACHVGDIGGLATDIGFLPTASFCGRIRGDYLNLTAEMCGNRFGRGIVRPGGTALDLDDAIVQAMLRKLAAIERDTAGAVNLFFSTPSVLSRLEGTGQLTPETARELGLVGVAARACGLPVDARFQQRPDGDYFGPDAIEVSPDGDVNARGRVRQREIQGSLAWINRTLAQLPEGEVRRPLPAAAPDSLAVALVEGWRGEIVHVGLTDRRGDFLRYKIVDPSFHNWSGLAHALRGGQISDFPLINKSFNLSYCGFDL